MNVCDSRIFDKKYMISLSVNKSTRKEIEEQTSWMSTTTPLKIRCLALYNGFTEETFPRCVVCLKNPVTYKKAYMDSFSIYCGEKCRKNHKHRLHEDTYKNLNSYDFLYDRRIIQRKSYEEIGQELGCSVIPVKKACRKLNIPEVKHNESQSIILLKLKDRSWLEQRHVIEKMKVQDIADSIGSSKATVSRWLNEHGIETNNPNIYDREFNHISKEQQEVVDFIKSITDEDIILNNRSILNGKEVDILLPSRKLMIEYNGIYSHIFRPSEKSESRRKDRNYHISKSKEAEKQGYRLIHIFSDDWVLRKDIWKGILRSVLSLPLVKLPARKLEIRNVDKTTKKIFLNENHLQGNDKSTISYGLWNSDVLIAIMTFSKSRYTKSHTWELSRFAVRLDHQCMGGFSRLLKHFEKNHDGDIISYADYSRSQGDVYKKNGFEMIHQNPPSYAYVNLSKSIQRRHRSNFTKKRLSIPDNVTENDHMVSIGYSKIFDCGTLVFLKKTKNPEV